MPLFPYPAGSDFNGGKIPRSGTDSLLQPTYPARPHYEALARPRLADSAPTDPLVPELRRLVLALFATHR